MALYRIVGLNSTPLLYPLMWVTQGDSVDMVPFYTVAGIRFTLSNCRYGPEGARFLKGNWMSLLAEHESDTFVQVGAVEVNGSLRESISDMAAHGLQQRAAYQDHLAAFNRGRQTAAWSQSMAAFKDCLMDRFGVHEGQTYRIFEAGDQELHCDPRIDRSWVCNMAGELLAIHHSHRPSLYPSITHRIDQSDSAARILMDAAAHHLALQEIPLVSQKRYKVTSEIERVAGAMIDDRYLMLFDFNNAPRADREQNGFPELMRQAYWQMHLSYARTAAA